ncbi:MAG: nprA [Bacteroidetes bacterium]|nr:nprA [Bacteroidota bacterium]
MNVVKKYLILFLFACCYSGSFAEKFASVTDSLEQQLGKAKDDNERFGLQRALVTATVHPDPEKAWKYIADAEATAERMNDSAKIGITCFLRGNYLFIQGYSDSALVEFTQATALLKRFNVRSELAECYTSIGNLHMDRGSYPQALSAFEKATELAALDKNDRLLCEDLMGMGMVLNQSGNRPKGLAKLQQALVIAEKLGHKKNVAQIMLYIGSAYSETKNEDYALDYFRRAQEIAWQQSDTALLVEVDMFIGNSHYYGKRYEKSIESYEQVLRLVEKSDGKIYAGALGNIGNVYADMGENEKALEYQFRAVGLFEKIGDKQGLTICYSAIGTSFYALKQYSKAIEYYSKALAIAEEISSWEDLIEIHLGMSRTYEALNDYKKAYDNFKLYKQFNDSVYNADNTRRLTELELNYRFDVQQKEQELMQKNKETLADEKLKRQQLLSYSSIVGIVLLLFLVGFILRSMAQRKKANIQLQEFNKEVLGQKSVIEHKNKEITDSINYAKRIQESILPVRKEIQAAFPQSFVLFKPRDVVSGDFYWYARRGDKNIIACVDCTGHGVPGAFMSMIGNTLLNEIVNEKGIEKPSEILDLLNERVRQSLKQDLADNGTQDGMDLALCSIDLKRGILEYAGANRSLYIVRNDALDEIKPTKSAIGGHKLIEDKKFQNHEIRIQDNDSIYMTTDGYADQFGGSLGKKFMVKRLNQLLIELQPLPMEQQGERLERSLESWQGNVEQVDDILVIGIKLSF